MNNEGFNNEEIVFVRKKSFTFLFSKLLFFSRIAEIVKRNPNIIELTEMIVDLNESIPSKSGLSNILISDLKK